MASHCNDRRRLLLQAGGALALAGLAPAARAQQGLPTGTIRILVGFPPGGGSDIMARYVADKLRERTGANVIVENRAGASGAIAIEVLKRRTSTSAWRRRCPAATSLCR